MASAARNPKQTSWSRFRAVASSRQVRTAATVFNAVAPIVVLALVYLGGRDVIQSQKQVEAARLEQEKLSTEIAQLSTAKKDLAQQKADLLKEKKNLDLEVLQLKGQVQELTGKVEENDPERVIRDVEVSLGGKTKGERADSFWRRGRDAFTNGNAQLAEALYLRAIKEDETFAAAHIGMGRLAADRHEFKVAEKHYKRARKADTSNPHAAYNLALTEFILGDKEAAREMASVTLQLDPQYQPAKDLLQQLDSP